MSCGVGRRHGLDLALLRLWCRPAAVALIRPLAWKPPLALGKVLRRQKKKKKPQNGYTVFYSIHMIIWRSVGMERKFAEVRDLRSRAFNVEAGRIWRGWGRTNLCGIVGYKHKSAHLSKPTKSKTCV